MDNWTLTPIGSQITLQRGIDITKNQQRPGNIPVVSSGGIKSYHDTPHSDGPGVILGRKGTLGSVYWLTGSYWPHDTTLWVRDFKGNNPRYVFYFFRDLDVMGLDVGSANPTLNRNHVHVIETPWPPLSEQNRIAAVLGALDDKIENNRKMNETLEAMAQAIFKSWFVDFDPVIDNAIRAGNPIPADLEPKAARRREAMARDDYKKQPYADLFPDQFVDSTLGSLPVGWASVTAASLCQRVENGGTPSRSREEFWKPAELNWLSSKEVRQPFIVSTESRISRLGFKKSSAKIWAPGTTVVALYGATAGQVTMLGIDTTANQACCGLTPKPGYQCLLYHAFLDKSAAIKNLATGSAQQNLSQSIIAETNLVGPSSQVVDLYDRTAAPLIKKQILNMQESQTLASLRDTLLPKLISGELRVPEIQGLVEEAL